jgi:mannose-6-phosphate isomerase-like protein (cupin superfamily)
VTSADGGGREHDERPWGSYTVLDDDADTHKVKRIVVLPGKRLSYQRHAHRAEHWFVVEGSARVTLDGAAVDLGPGGSIDIPRAAAHRIENPGASPLVFVEVQHGDYFGEDDIERLEDDFGRAGTR